MSVSLWKVLHVRFLCCPPNARADVVLSSISNTLLFFQAKGRIVVVPGNVLFVVSNNRSCGPQPPPSLLPWRAMIWLPEPGPQEEELLPWCQEMPCSQQGVAEPCRCCSLEDLGDSSRSMGEHEPRLLPSLFLCPGLC